MSSQIQRSCSSLCFSLTLTRCGCCMMINSFDRGVLSSNNQSVRDFSLKRFTHSWIISSSSRALVSVAFLVPPESFWVSLVSSHLSRCVALRCVAHLYLHFLSLLPTTSSFASHTASSSTLDPFVSTFRWVPHLSNTVVPFFAVTRKRKASRRWIVTVHPLPLKGNETLKEIINTYIHT